LQEDEEEIHEASRKNHAFCRALMLILGLAFSPLASAQQKRPNIIVIMGDDVGWFNIGACPAT
jgi:hypothetical protein